MIEPKLKKKISTILSGIILGLPLLSLYIYNYSSYEFSVLGFELKKIELGQEFDEDTTIAIPTNTQKTTIINPEKVSNDSTVLKLERKDSTVAKPRKSDSVEFTLPELSNLPAKLDSSQQRIMLIGDSEAGGIFHALNDYCAENNHRLDIVFTWYSASIFNFGYSNRVDQLIEKYKPTFIIIVLGLNELYARDIDRRKKAAVKFHEKLSNIPYLWVGPANYTADKGINAVFSSTAQPGRFFLSKDLVLPRSSDQRHPNGKGYRIWMNQIANYMQSSSLYSFNFKHPTKTGYRFRGKIISANAAKDRGY
jgi:hypothetical protein